MQLWILGLLSGILVGTSWIPFPPWALFVGLAPLWIAVVRAPSVKKVLFPAWLAQFTFNLIGFHWVAHTANEFGHIPWVLSFLILLGYAAYANIHVVLTAVLVKYAQQKWKISPTAVIIAAASLFPVIDWFFPQIFSWNLGFPLLYAHWPMAQLAEFIGFWGLGWIVSLVQGWLACLWLRRTPTKSFPLQLGLVILTLVVLNLLGYLTVGRLPAEDRSFKILAIQPNVGNFEKAFAEKGQGYQEPITNDLFEITQMSLKDLGDKPQIVIWPETAYPAPLDEDFQHLMYAQKLSRFAQEIKLPILTGGYSEDPITKPNRNPQGYNALFLIDDTGKLLARYRKTILLAFGEYFPGAKYFPWLKKLVPEISDFDSGSGPTIMEHEGVKMGVQICYEGLETLFVRDIANLGAHMHVNLTNDSWFGKVFEPEQHMIMTVARSVETRRPVIRVTNTGYTTVYNVKGERLFRSPLFEHWAWMGDVKYYSEPKTTLYMILAPFLPWAGLIWVILLLLFAPKGVKEN